MTIARSLTYLGVLGHFTKEWDQSRRYLEEALTYWEEAGDTWGSAYAILYLGAIEVRREHYQEGMWLLEESLARYREIGDGSARGIALLWLAYAAGGQGDVVGAVGYLRKLRKLSTEAQDQRLLNLCGAGVAWLLRKQGDAEQLTHLLGAIQQVREMMGIDRGRIFYTSAVIAITTETLGARLDQETFEAALAEGRSLTFQQMAALIRDVLDAAAQAGASEKVAQEHAPRNPLSEREQEVLRLVTEGLSNKQIARELIIAQNTVKFHVTSIFNKLGVDTRAQAVAVAAQRDLL